MWFWKDREVISAYLDGERVLQRFKLLFPDLYDATVDYVAYRDRVMPEYYSVHRHSDEVLDAHYGRHMQFVYGVMTQLLDMNDPCEGSIIGNLRFPDSYLTR
jgi:hypothetical protein